MSLSPEFAARLMAVQACYEMLSTKRALKVLIEDYLERGLQIDDDIEAKPKESLFKSVLESLDENLSEIIKEYQNYKKDKEVEPLLKAIALCGITEIRMENKDKALIIDEYLNVTHSFYEQGQVSYINGVLDAAAKALR